MGHWLHHLWFTWVYPSLKGNGPEAAIQTVVYAGIAVLVWPPARRWFRAEQAELHRKLDHVIRHSKDIPDLPPK